MIELNYSDTESTIEVLIYGLKFKINEEEIEKIDSNSINEEIDDKILKELIDKILGEGSVNKINEKRKKDGYDEMNLKIEMQVFTFIMERYADEILRPVNRTVNKFKNYKGNKNNRFKKFNRYGR